MIRIHRFLLVVTLSMFSVLAHAQVESINLAKFNDQETLTVFFEKPQIFKSDQLQNLFKVEKYDYEDWERKPYVGGEWHLSKDGYRLSYYPITMGSYTVSSNTFKNDKGDDYREYLYLGKSAQAVKIIGRGPVMPLSQGSLPIEMIGTDEVDIEFFKIDNLPRFLDRYYIASTINRWDLNRVVKEMTPAGIFRYKKPLNVPRETKSLHNVPVDKNIQPGAYIVAVNPAGEIDRTLDIRIVFITDIGLHARLYPTETVIVGNHFSSGEPVDGAVIEVWRNNNGQIDITEDLCTFTNGLCRIHKKLAHDDIVVAKYGTEFSVLPLKEIALDLNDYAVDGKLYSKQVAHVYSNRELYRPGESMPINVLLRDQDGHPLVNQPINIKLINPNHKVVYENTLDAEVDGFYHTYLATGLEDPTGRWRVEVRTDATAVKADGELLIFLEEFMPERMELTLSGVNDHYDMQDPIHLNIDSRYLFGAPADHNSYKIQGKLSINRTPFMGHKDWYVGKTVFPYQFIPDEIAYEENLNAEGHANQALYLGLEGPLAENISAVLRLSASVNVLDGGTSGIARNFATNFWPTKSVPVIRPLFNESDLGYGSDAMFEVFSANYAGQLENGEFKLTLRYQDSACTWVYNPNSGWDCHENDRYQIREQKVVKSTGEVVSYRMSPNSWGQYILEVEDLSSGMITEYPFSASWRSTESGQLSVAKPNTLALTTDKPAYQTGDTIALTVDAPFDGNLTLMLEGSELLYHQNLTVKQGKNSLSIPIDENWNRHDLYLSGLLLSKTKQDEVVRSLGLIPIHLNRVDRKLEPKLSFDAIALPDHQVTIKIAVPNVSPQEQLYATVSVTDQGILNMIPIQNESIFDAFFKHRKYQIDIIDYYNRLFKRGAYSMLVPKFGGDGEMEEGHSPDNITEMKTVSLMSSLITLDDKGNGEVTFNLPDFNGEAKVVVKVFSTNRVGELDQQMIIRAPIVADVITPRFLRVGDHSHLSLSLHNMSGSDDAVSIKVKSDQFAVDFDEQIPLQDGKGAYRLVPISLPTFTNFAEIQLEIDGKSYQATRSYRIGTDPIAEKTTHYQRALLDKGALWERDAKITGLYDRNYQETMTVSRYPQINVLSYTDGLFSYPYGCTEQTTSAAFPWLFKSNKLLDIEKKAVYSSYVQNQSENTSGQPVLDYDAWEKEMLRDTVKRLLVRQQSDGGFAFWSSGQSYYPSSVYAIDFLSQLAKKSPTLVPQEALQKSYDYLKQRLTQTYASHTNSGSQYLEESALNNLSYAIWLLAREGKIFSADIAFMEQFTHQLSPLARVQLAGANLLLSRQKAAKNYLATLNFMGWERGFGTYQTHVSALARSIDIFNELSVKGLFDQPALIQDLGMQLSQSLSEKRYFSTQERYALIKVGLATPDDTQPIHLTINGRIKKVTANEPIHATDIAKMVTDTPIFIEYAISGYPNQAVDAREFNVDYHKRYWTRGKDVLEVGDRFVVYLTIQSSKNLPNALLVDYIPSGFTLVNPNLLTNNVDEFYAQQGADKLTRNVLENEEYRFDRYVAAFDLKRNQEYRFAYILEAQIPGESHMPVTILEDMYIPELRNVMVNPQTFIIKEKSSE